MNSPLVVGAAPAAGACEFYSRLLSDASHVVAADAAGEWCVEHGRVPDVVVGDFDSADPGARERLAALGAEIVTHPCDKDDTDLDLAIALARDRFDGPVRITAAFSERIDHTLAALGSLMRAGSGAEAVEPGWHAAVCAPGCPLSLSTPEPTPVSVLAPGGASGVTLRGTRWELSGARLEPLSGRGVSNESVEARVQVEVVLGTLLVIVGCWTPP